MIRLFKFCFVFLSFWKKKKKKDSHQRKINLSSILKPENGSFTKSPRNASNCFSFLIYSVTLEECPCIMYFYDHEYSS